MRKTHHIETSRKTSNHTTAALAALVSLLVAGHARAEDDIVEVDPNSETIDGLLIDLWQLLKELWSFASGLF